MHNTTNATAIYSSIASGYGNEISDGINLESNRGYSIIGGGKNNQIDGGWSGILEDYQIQ